MRFGGLSDALTAVLLALCTWVLVASGAYRHTRMDHHASEAAALDRRNAISVRSCASMNCPEVWSIGPDDRLETGMHYGYGWHAVRVTGPNGRTVSGVLRSGPLRR